MTDRPLDRPLSDSLIAPAPALAPRRDGPRANSPIVPRSSIAGRALIVVVAIMTFLASLTTGAVMLVLASAAEWQSHVGRAPAACGVCARGLPPPPPPPPRAVVCGPPPPRPNGNPTWRAR